MFSKQGHLSFDIEHFYLHARFLKTSEVGKLKSLFFFRFTYFTYIWCHPPTRQAQYLELFMNMSIYSLKEPFFEKATLLNDYTNDKNHFQHD